MKKYILLAVLTMGTCLGCTRVAVQDGGAGTQVAFLVANYANHTKNSAFSGEFFKTSAWFHPSVEGGSQPFMDGETVIWQESISQWTPDRPYYWPKNGYVNFFSWANTPEPTSVSEGTFQYGTNDAPLVLDPADDPLLASAAYRYSADNANDDSFHVTYNGVDVKGVPTLFHHMAAKVNIVIRFDASDVNPNEKLSWRFSINSATLSYANAGYLDVAFTDPKNTATQDWPFTTTPPVLGWDWTSQTELEGNTPVQEVKAGEAAEGDFLFEDVTVVPQDISEGEDGTAATLSFSYTLTDYWDQVQHVTETVNLNGDDALVLTKVAPAITSWYMNYRYTYTITVRPNATVTFDPAVVPWDDTNFESPIILPVP